tara:strand:+ start:8248 stop:8691 length:444 start_codon:yes stop_codon:yes gene_type:complete
MDTLPSGILNYESNQNVPVLHQGPYTQVDDGHILSQGGLVAHITGIRRQTGADLPLRWDEYMDLASASQGRGGVHYVAADSSVYRVAIGGTRNFSTVSGSPESTPYTIVRDIRKTEPPQLVALAEMERTNYKPAADILLEDIRDRIK